MTRCSPTGFGRSAERVLDLVGPAQEHVGPLRQTGEWSVAAVSPGDRELFAFPGTEHADRARSLEKRSEPA